MRGAHFFPARRTAFSGIIPAYAGSTRCSPATRQRARDHPRVCGEHVEYSAPSVYSVGSSPRMRGAPAVVVLEVVRVGIIPAYARSTGRRARTSTGSRDHPRVCGEHQGGGPQLRRAPGSSPRMRGAHRGVPLDNRGEGIIPAYAGSTSSADSNRYRCEDHPRVCGEHQTGPSSSSPTRESSPRMRGAHLRLAVDGVLYGIIPAYAGSTRKWCIWRGVRWDHPRVCGEHSRSLTSRVSIPGSSPRMRGAHGRVVLEGLAHGIIPAYAGSTQPARRLPRRCRDHPRVCGEHTEASSPTFSRSGSSPRMRGARIGGTNRWFQSGIIPAYAGST